MGLQAEIRRIGFLLQIKPNLSFLLREYLSYQRRTGFRQGRSEYKDVKLYVEGADEAGQPCLYVPAGLTHIVLDTLSNAGYAVEFKDLRQRVLGPPDMSRLDPVRPGQGELVTAIINSDHGIVVAPTGSGKSWTIRQVCKIWPKARVIIVIPGAIGSGLLNQTYDELLSYFPDTEVGIVGGGHRYARHRITVAMDRSLAHCELEQCDILIFDEVHHAATEKNAECLSRVTDARRFGFSASPWGRSDKADLETVSLFGDTIYETTYQMVQATGGVVPVAVMMVNTDRSFTPNQDRISSETPVATAGRELVWCNKARNGQIAAAVRLVEQVEPQSQVLILVKTTEHAVMLGSLLPDYTLVYGDMKPQYRVVWEREGLLPVGVHPITTAERASYEEAFKAGTLRKVIATQLWATGMDFPYLNVLVRADAQSSLIANTQWSGRVTRAPTGKLVGLVVDFTDGFHEMTRHRSATRRRAYVKKGWEVAEIEV